MAPSAHGLVDSSPISRQGSDKKNVRTRGDIPVNDTTAAVGSPSSPVAPMSSAFAKALKEKYGQVVLVLQGGGALGAYQVGVYQALDEAGVEPDWVIGTSIGAINGAMIAGNPIATPMIGTQEEHTM